MYGIKRDYNEYAKTSIFVVCILCAFFSYFFPNPVSTLTLLFNFKWCRCFPKCNMYNNHNVHVRNILR